MKKILSVFAVLQLVLLNSLIAQTTYTSFSTFKTAVSAASAGDIIILQDGTYSGSSISMENIVGTETNPIVVKAETVGGVTLNDASFSLEHCEYVTFQGFNINITDVYTVFKIQTCNNIRITQNVLDGTNESNTSSVWVMIQSVWDDVVNLSHHNRIDHNVFSNKSSLGNMVRIDGTNDLWVSQYDMIDNNYFKNLGPRADNEKEAIRIGWSEMSESDGYCTVTKNLFEECNGDPEIISVKCNKNTISHNTFRRCQGTLSLRHGNGSLVEGNFFLGEGYAGTGGIRIYGSDHVIINNYFEGLTGTKWDAPITLTEGDADEGNTALSKHFRIERAIIANNTLVNNDYGIEIGYDNNGSYSKPPRDVVMAYNIISGSSNSLVNYINAPDNMTWFNNIVNLDGTATVGTNVTFSETELDTVDPVLVLDGYYKASATSPTYTPTLSSVGSVLNDIDIQLRSIPTNYGADEYSVDASLNHPLSSADVGPSTGEYLFTSASNKSFYTAGGDFAVAVSSNLEWEITGTNTWVSVDASTGTGDGTFTITVAENSSGLDREQTLTITSTNSAESSELVETFVVSQLGVDPPYIDLSATEINFVTDGEAKSFNILSNTNWTVSNGQSWASVDIASGSNNATIEITVEANESLNSRRDTIRVSDGATLNYEILIIQDPFVGTEQKLNVVSAVASTEQVGNEAAHLIDNDLTNRWSGDGDGAYVTFNLEQEYEVSFVKIGLYKGDSRTSTFDVQISRDGVTYTDVLTNVTSEITDEDLTISDFTDDTASFVRLVGHGNSSSSWNSYTELEVWGWEIPIDTLVNADLSEITVDGEALTSFRYDTLSYTFEVPYGTTSTIPNVDATTRIDEADVAITQAGSVPGKAVLLVTAKDNSTEKTYEVSFVETAPSTDATLSAITVGGIAVSSFNAATLTYTFEVPQGTTTVPALAATTTSNLAQVPVITNATAIGETGTIVVMAQDGVTSLTYKVTIVFGTTSVRSIEELKSSSLFPNPSSGNFIVSNSVGAEIIVYNTIGKVVYRNTIANENQMHYTNLSDGLYIVAIQFEGNQEIMKLLIE